MSILQPRNLFICLILLWTQAVTGSTPVPLPENFSPVGNGKLTWFGLRVYDATLYAEDGRYNPANGHALHITYNMSFSRTTLAARSLTEIERLFGNQPEPEKTKAELAAVFCDVASGDSILGLHQPGQSAAFYCNDKLLGLIEDPELAQAFFAIWLDKDTSEPELRNDLLGESS